MSKIGVVVIGRNEGERLKNSLISIQKQAQLIVYVDSGSTDGSVAFAQSLGIDVIELDLSIPFTAARARNSGFNHLIKLYPQIEFVQFIDGDCQLIAGWIEAGIKMLENQPEIAVVSGRTRELFPHNSIYNQLCDMEWNTPIGEVKYCGGIAMMRVQAFQEVGGFRDSLIAGEEPELCVRFRNKGWKIYRLDAEMTLHDAAMTQFYQWWKRNIRAGHAYAEGSSLHGKETGHWVKETMSNWLWGLILPIIIINSAFFTQGWSLLLFLLYPILGYKIYRYMRQNYPSQEAALYAVFCVIGKIPQVQGQIKYYLNRLLHKSSTIVEYKTAVDS